MSKKKKPGSHRAQPTQQWQPIARLPELHQHLSGMLESGEEQYQNLLEAKPKPWVLDDDTINRVIKAFTGWKRDVPLFEKQAQRWESQVETDGQRAELEQMRQVLVKLRQVTENVLTLSEELKRGTLERQLAKSDAELGLEVLLRGFPTREKRGL